MEDNVPKKASLVSSKFKTRRTKAILGLYIAFFVCNLAGMQNDVIMAKYLPLEFSSDSAIFGITFTMFSLGKLILMIPLAKMSDKFGRKPFLLFTFGIYSMGTFLAGVAQTIEQFLFFRFLKGMSSFEGIALALINDYFEEGERGKPIAFMFASIGLGNLLGTLSGGFFLNWFELRNAFYFLGFITFISVLAVMILVRNSPQTKNSKQYSGPSKSQKKFIRSQVNSILHDRNFLLGITNGTIIIFIYSGTSSYIIYLILNYFNVENELSGLLLLPVNGAYIALSLTMGHKENTQTLIKKGFAILVIIFLSFMILKWINRVFIFILLLILCFALLGVLMPAIDNFESNLVPQTIKGEALGIYRSITLVGSIIGATTVGIIGSLFWAFTPFVLMAFLSLVGLLISFQIKLSN